MSKETLLDIWQSIYEEKVAETAELEKQAAAQESLEALQKLASFAAMDLVRQEMMEKEATRMLADVFARGIWEGFMKAAAKDTGALATDGGTPGNAPRTTGYLGLKAKDTSPVPTAPAGGNAEYMKILREQNRQKATPGSFTTADKINQAQGGQVNALMNIPSAPKAM